MDGLDDTPYASFFPNPVSTAEAQALGASEQYALHVYDTHMVGPSAAAVLTPGSRSFSVGKPEKRIDVNTVPFFLRTSKRAFAEVNGKAAGRYLDGDASAM